MYRDGFTGALALQNLESLSEEETGAVLSRLNYLSRWVQAQQAKVLFRMQNIYENESMFLSGRPDSDMAFSLAAEEAAAILGVTTGTGTALMGEARMLCSTHTATLGKLEAGRISYGHVRTAVEQSIGVPAVELPGFETGLLELADGQTAAQFRVKARRLRENQFPETIVKRQRTAFETRRVCLQPDADGMSWLSAFLSAETAQAIYSQLNRAARGEQAAGDPRKVDQLRADILAGLLGGPEHQCSSGGCGNCCGKGSGTGNDAGKGDVRGSKTGGAGKGNKGSKSNGSGKGSKTNGAGKGNKGGKSNGSGKGNKSNGAGKASKTNGRDEASSSEKTTSGMTGSGNSSGRHDRGGSGTCRIGHGHRARTEILVVISAETLFGADDRAAELVGYGPISPERARRMVRDAAKWTPVERNPETEEILRVGRRRKVPEGLKQLLRVRDGTCRFPGCRTNAVISEIDHTKPWVQGGATDHDNLEHLCRRHHMFKSEGFWKACQPSPGIIEWTSPGGRKYRTEPDLTLAAAATPATPAMSVTTAADAVSEAAAVAEGDVDKQDASDPDDYGDNPPPF